MSAWTEVTGNIRMRNGTAFSLNKYISIEFDEVIIRYINQSIKGESIWFDVNFVFSDSNLASANKIQNLVNKLREVDKNAVVDLEANIRFLA
jgi:hypothetical protein